MRKTTPGSGMRSVDFGRPRLLLPLLIVALLASGLTGCLPVGTGTPSPTISAIATSTAAPTVEGPTLEPTATMPPTQQPTPSPEPVLPVDSLTVQFLDVGQADSILIQVGSHAMLIDAGNNNDSVGVVGYLKSQGVKTLDYVVGTHPHEDHIGGLDAVISAFGIGRILLPNATNNTATYEDVLDAIAAKGAKITVPKVGAAYDLGSAHFVVLSPASASYPDLNEYSIVIRMTYGRFAFLFCGDAQALDEQEMLASGATLTADVLKVGHHGSDTSSTPAFLQAVSPEYAVISVGAGNTYGHPTAGTLANLAAVGAEVHRTDLDGTIVVKSDGSSLQFSFKDTSIDGSGGTTVANPTTKPAVTSAPVDATTTVYRTATGMKYHLDGCQYLSKSRIALSLSDAKTMGLAPCSVCKPPQ